MAANTSAGQYRIIRYAHAGRVTLTFWEGLESIAVPQVELLQVAELSCTCQTIAESANSTVPLRAEARSLQATRFAKAKLTFWEGLELVAFIE